MVAKPFGAKVAYDFFKNVVGQIVTDLLHKSLGYNGVTRYKVVQDSLDQAKMIITWANGHYPN